MLERASTSALAYEVLRDALTSALLNPNAAAELRSSAAISLPKPQREQIEHVFNLRLSYREALAIQIAYRLADDTIDMRQRQEGGRGVAQKFAELLAASHIAATKDAFQNIGKNQTNLVRGNAAAFDDLLVWGATADAPAIKAAFDYTITGLARLSRPVLEMVDLNIGRLTFFNTSRLIDDLLRTPSGGAHEQFAAAACIEAIIEEFNLGGIAGLRVETKNLTASDASSKTAGDIQIKRLGRTEEAFEVSASNWSSKLGQSRDAIRSADLVRAHILASFAGKEVAEAVELGEIAEDVSVIDIHQFLRLLVAVMRKPARAATLRRLYQLLDRNQPNIELVNAYVRLIKQHGLAAEPS
jgi:hypothetical protein